MKNSRIAIIYPYPNLDTVPSLCAAIELMADHGIQVDVFMPAPVHFEFPQFDNRIVQIVAPKAHAISNIQSVAYSKYLWPIRTLLRPVKDAIKLLLFGSKKPRLDALLQRHRRAPYKCIIGVDHYGIAMARGIADSLRVPLVYWSLELLLSEEIPNEGWRELKEQELSSSREAAFIIIQDEERAQLMASDNGLPMSKFVFIPNAPFEPNQTQRSRYWHQHLALSKNQKVVLHAGSLEDWTGINNIVSSVKEWPDEWVLVVHARFQSIQDATLEELRAEAKSDRVFFSTHPAPRTKYSELVAGADVGIAFYLPVYDSPYTQENIHTIGLSSGKIAYYLRAGLPVIVNRWPFISRVIEQERCGVVVDDAAEIGDALKMIAQQYEEYSANARKLFEKRLNPLNGIQQLISQIDAL